LTGPLYHLWSRFSVALAAAALLAGGNPAVTSGFQLGDRGGLVELGDGTKNLTREDCGRCILSEEIGSGGRDQGDAELA
jgi:hypothetical protein